MVPFDLSECLYNIAFCLYLKLTQRHTTDTLKLCLHFQVEILDKLAVGWALVPVRASGSVGQGKY